MNERIKQLALQAGEHANSVYVPPIRSKTPGKIWEDGHVDWHDIYNQKFAELIVQECVDIVASRPYIDDGNWPHPSTMIRQHFGVK